MKNIKVLSKLLVLIFLISVKVDFAHAGNTDGSFAFKKVDYAADISYLKKLAEQGDTAAMILPGQMYIHPKYGYNNFEESFKWYQLAAEKGNSRAEYMVGMVYASDARGMKDINKALKWFNRSAENNYPFALGHLARMYFDGEEVERDLKKSYQLGLKSANMNHIPGQSIVAMFYEHGVYVKKDKVKALMWYGIILRQRETLPIKELQLHYEKAEKKNCFACK